MPPGIGYGMAPLKAAIRGGAKRPRGISLSRPAPATVQDPTRRRFVPQREIVMGAPQLHAVSDPLPKATLRGFIPQREIVTGNRREVFGPSSQPAFGGAEGSLADALGPAPAAAAPRARTGTSPMGAAVGRASMAGGMGFAGHMTNAFAGGIAGATFAGEGERGKGFVGGAVAGGLLGAGAASYARKGFSTSRGALSAMDAALSKEALGPIATGYRGHAAPMLRKGVAHMHSSSGRNAMFRSGAMLGGGAFGVMFASNGRSHKRGFNQNRGNSFSR